MGKFARSAISLGLLSLISCGGNDSKDKSLQKIDDLPLNFVSVDPLSLEWKLRESYDGQHLSEPNRSARLSNGMKIPNYARVLEAEWGDVFIIETGYESPTYDIRVYDFGDEKPFVFLGVYEDLGVYEEDEEGFEKWELGVKSLKKRFDLTYKYCDKGHGPYGNGSYPIWGPTDFRGDPCYLANAETIEFLNESGDFRRVNEGFVEIKKD